MRWHSDPEGRFVSALTQGLLLYGLHTVRQTTLLISVDLSLSISVSLVDLPHWVNISSFSFHVFSLHLLLSLRPSDARSLSFSLPFPSLPFCFCITSLLLYYHLLSLHSALLSLFLS